MPLYRYSGNSIISEARFIKNETGATRAYLHANPQATPEQLNAVISDLRKTGCVALPLFHNGQNVLEVRAFGKESNLRIALGEMGAVQGTPYRDELGEDKLSIGAWFKQKSLIISSILYLLGDFCFIRYEKVNTKIKETKKEEKKNAVNSFVTTYNAENPANSLPEYTGELENRSKLSKSKVWDWLAGYGYLAGSTSSLASMLMRGDTSNIELGNISRFISSAAVNAGLAVEDSLALQQANTFKDTRSPFARNFTTYSAEMMNLSFATAGLAITKDSIETYTRLNKEEKLYGGAGYVFDQRHKDDKSIAFKDSILGIGTLLSGVSSSLIKEKPVDPNKERKKGLAGVWEYLKERPLRIAGAGYLISTVIHLWSSIQERRSIIQDNKNRSPDNQFPKDHTGWRLGFVIMNLMAEVIMYFSSKGHGEGMKSDESLDNTACAMVAQMIHKQPVEQREQLVEAMAKTLAKPQALGLKLEIAKELLKEQLENIDKNPWMSATASHNKEEGGAVLGKEKTMEQSTEKAQDIEKPVESVAADNSQMPGESREHSAIAARKTGNWQETYMALQANPNALSTSIH